MLRLLDGLAELPMQFFGFCDLHGEPSGCGVLHSHRENYGITTDRFVSVRR